MRTRGAHGPHLLELIQVGLALERPQSGHVVWQLELLAWPPVLDKATFICRDDAVESVAVLPRGVRSRLSEPRQKRGRERGNARSSNGLGTDGASPPSPMVYHPHDHRKAGWYQNCVLS